MPLQNHDSSQNSNSGPGLDATSRMTAGAFFDVRLGGDALTCWDVVTGFMSRYLSIKIPENTT